MPAATVAGSFAGTLVSVPAITSGYDFYYPMALSRPLSALQPGVPVKLQARFIWDGPARQAIHAAQHAIVAFTQKGAPHSWRNPEGQLFWTHGAGAYVGNNGLALELWFRSDPARNGVQDDPPDAIVWDQTNARCAYLVTVGPTSSMCLGAGASALAGYLTPAAFTLRKGVGYWVRVTLTRETANPARATLRGELLEESGNGAAMVVQTGQVGFVVNRFFPYADQRLEASIARTPGPVGEGVTRFVAFGGGF
ncbi:MAG: hypothetical protein QM740_10165 [Acidovorax sp.]